MYAGSNSISVALVTMPFGSCWWPSYQIGLLKAIAQKRGFNTVTFHLNLDFAMMVGQEMYELAGLYRETILGDWLFSPVVFGEGTPDKTGEIFNRLGPELITTLERGGKTQEWLLETRNRLIPDYITGLVEGIPWEEFRVVGFTSTFQQNLASFALAKALKQRHPNIITVFGGANFDGELGLELVKQLDCIDYAVCGEGDQAFPELLEAFRDGTDPGLIPGLIYRKAGEVVSPRSRGSYQNLDELPVPDFSEYFERACAVGFIPPGYNGPFELPFESSRGCWWGEKHHCTFCGLNQTGICFRSKNPARLLQELNELSVRYSTRNFVALENIVDFSYYKTFFPALKSGGFNYKFFFEIKSNIRRDELKLLRESGVGSLQPGIESLNDHVLKLINKGTTLLQNLNTLRWSRYYGFDTKWNLLYGFPGETAEDYSRQLRLLKNLAHLQAPGYFGRIWLSKFSPYFNRPDIYPLRYCRPAYGYRYVYPVDFDLERLAFFYEYLFEDSLPDEIYRETGLWITEWKKRREGNKKPTLTFWEYRDFVLIEDARDISEPRTIILEEPYATIYLGCNEKPHTARSIKEKTLPEASLEEVQNYLEELEGQGQLVGDGTRYLCLALPGKTERYYERGGYVYLSKPFEITS